MIIKYFKHWVLSCDSLKPFLLGKSEALNDNLSPFGFLPLVFIPLKIKAF